MVSLLVEISTHVVLCVGRVCLCVGVGEGVTGEGGEGVTGEGGEGGEGEAASPEELATRAALKGLPDDQQQMIQV